MDAKKSLAIDSAALAAYLVAANPSLTGIGAHEWLGLGVSLVFLVHAAVNAGWVAAALRASFKSPNAARTGNLVLDALIAAALAVCAVSGVMVSGAVLPAFGLYAEGYFFWDPLHAASAKALLALLLVHVAVHWRWLAGFFGKGKKRKAADLCRR